MRIFFGEAEGGSVVASSEKGRVGGSVQGSSAADPLGLLDRLLTETGAGRADIDEIVIDRGPGGYSSVRRRIAVAAALGRSLGSRIAAVIGPFSAADAAALQSSDFTDRASIEPLYIGVPNITSSRKKKTWTAR